MHGSDTYTQKRTQHIHLPQPTDTGLITLKIHGQEDDDYSCQSNQAESYRHVRIVSVLLKGGKQLESHVCFSTRLTNSYRGGKRMIAPDDAKWSGVTLLRGTNADQASYSRNIYYAVKTEGSLMAQAASSRILLLSTDRGRTKGTSHQSLGI